MDTMQNVNENIAASEVYISLLPKTMCSTDFRDLLQQVLVEINLSCNRLDYSDAHCDKNNTISYPYSSMLNYIKMTMDIISFIFGIIYENNFSQELGHQYACSSYIFFYFVS